MSLNKVMLIGHLGNDPEKIVTNSGSTVASFSLATSESYKDKQGNKQKKTEWHKIVLWNKLADLAEEYLSKGKQVYIEGSLSTKEWKDKDGNKRYTTEIIGQVLKFIDSKSNDQNPINNRIPDKEQNPLNNDNFDTGVDPDLIDDIPFF